jgi:hypothetical protein
VLNLADNELRIENKNGQILVSGITLLDWDIIYSNVSN